MTWVTDAVEYSLIFEKELVKLRSDMLHGDYNDIVICVLRGASYADIALSRVT
jgi:hypothetical protein